VPSSTSVNRKVADVSVVAVTAIALCMAAFLLRRHKVFPVAVMIAALAAVNAATVADGRGHTYFYGEGWDQGAEVDTAISPAIQAAPTAARPMTYAIFGLFRI